MGTWYDFACSNCPYRAKVSGGPDVGVHAVTHTVACEECDGLLDAHKSSENDGPSVIVDYVCPRQRGHAKHTIRFWTHPGPCPKCGHRMVRGAPLDVGD
ncbi:MAG: hypothetical protein U0169_24740 [Polyangiaceae bacterium]